MVENFDEMAEALLEQFEAWVSVQPNGEQLLAAMDAIDEAVYREESLGAEECWAVSQAALGVAAAASGVAGFEPIAITYQTIARLYGVAAAARREKR